MDYQSGVLLYYFKLVTFIITLIGSISTLGGNIHKNTHIAYQFIENRNGIAKSYSRAQVL